MLVLVKDDGVFFFWKILSLNRPLAEWSLWNKNFKNPFRNNMDGIFIIKHLVAISDNGYRLFWACIKMKEREDPK